MRDKPSQSEPMSIHTTTFPSHWENSLIIFEGPSIRFPLETSGEIQRSQFLPHVVQTAI